MVAAMAAANSILNKNNRAEFPPCYFFVNNIFILYLVIFFDIVQKKCYYVNK